MYCDMKCHKGGLSNGLRFHECISVLNRQSDDQRNGDLHFFHPEMSSGLLYNEYQRLLRLCACPVSVNCACEVPP